MFEMPPFWTCPKCVQQNAFGVLSVRENSYKRRCKVCRHSATYWLNDVEKKVIYLDQFAISEMMKAKASPTYESKHKAFWIALHEQVHRLVLLQQAIFPDSDVHSDESIVNPRHDEMRSLYESINGEVSLKNTTDVERFQMMDFAKSWIEGRGVPPFQADVDDVLQGIRNQWLSPLRISVSSNMRIFADDIRTSRDSLSEMLSKVFEKWKDSNSSFEQQLNLELAALGTTIHQQIVEGALRVIRSFEIHDPNDLLNVAMSRVSILNASLLQVFEGCGVPQEECQSKIFEFLRWDGLHQLPYHRISAYIFTALARKARSGQKRKPSRGMMNDIRAISSYAPYVDAMFLDKECVALLSENPLRTDLSYKARLFSLNDKDAFLEYLRNIERAADPEVILQARDVYGIE